MNQQMGLTEFFAMEAGEYLERLDSMVSGEAVPERDEFVRLTRALRGSALMANQEPIGNVAAALESLARAVKDGRAPWEEALKQATIRAVDGLKILVRSLGDWGEAESAKAQAIAAELTDASGSPVESLPKRPTAATDTGSRAFIAREGESVAGALNDAARALQRDGLKGDQLGGVLRTMQPLLGLAALSELSPLPEFLDGVGRAVAAATRSIDNPNDLALFFDIAAKGITRATKEITENGAAEPDSPEAREFARRLGQLLDQGSNAVPIEDLYYDDAGPHVVEAGVPSNKPSQMAQMELVAHGEHLCQAADELEKARGETQRKLRMMSLNSTLRTLGNAAGTPLQSAVSSFANAANTAVVGGLSIAQLVPFVTRLREAGEVLRASAEGDETTLATNLSHITKAVKTIATPPDESEAGGGPLTRPAAPSAAIESPQPIEPTSTVPEEQVTPTAVPAEPLAEPAVRSTVPTVPTESDPRASELEAVPDIAAGWAAYERLREAGGDTRDVPIAELLGQMAAQTAEQVTTAPVEATAPPTATVDGGAEVVPITDFCYSGAAALTHAKNLRDRIRNELSGADLNASLINDLIDELLDVVELSAE